MITAVASYHMTPLTCGVARFNARLAKELGVPFVSWQDAPPGALMSIKPDEMAPLDRAKLSAQCSERKYSLFLHSLGQDVSWTQGLAARAELVYTGSPHIADALGDHACPLWCPESLDSWKNQTGDAVLLFGMAHKLGRPVDHHVRLAALIPQDVAIVVSMALHEGYNRAEQIERTITLLRDVYGERLHVLGMLADDGLSRELWHAHAAVLLFDPAARANNTTIWAAMARACPVITTLDTQSPPALVHGETCFDLCQMTAWPTKEQLHQVGFKGRKVSDAYSWPALVRRFR